MRKRIHISLSLTTLKERYSGSNWWNSCHNGLMSTDGRSAACNGFCFLTMIK
jgi:hypothetical protein